LAEPFGRNFRSQSLLPRFVIYGRCNAFELSPDRADVQKKACLRVAAATAVASRDDVDKRGHVNDCGWQVDVWHRCPFPLIAGHVTKESSTSVKHLLRCLRQARRRLACAHSYIHHLRKIGLDIRGREIVDCYAGLEPVILEDGFVSRGTDRTDAHTANRLSRIRGGFHLNAVAL